VNRHRRPRSRTSPWAFLVMAAIVFVVVWTVAGGRLL
jgi:hypothetical protein